MNFSLSRILEATRDSKTYLDRADFLVSWNQVITQKREVKYLESHKFHRYSVTRQRRGSFSVLILYDY